MQMTPNCIAIVHLPILLSWRLEFFELLTQFTSGCPRTSSPSQHRHDTIHLAWYKAQSCQERYRSALQSTSVPDWTYIREEPRLNYRSRVKHEGPYHQTLPVMLLPASSNSHGSTLTSSAIQTLVHAFICTRVDFSNSLLHGTSAYLLDRLQSVLNSAARLILRIGKYDPISDAIRRDLHWLPVSFRI